MSQNKKTHLLNKRDSQIVILESKEAKILLDLAKKTDEIFTLIRKNAGNSINIDKANNTIKAWNDFLIETSCYIEEINKDLNIEYLEPISIVLLKEEIKTLKQI
ncbi:hypothetical protein PQO74_000427 [Campylobacter lari]|uniref:hypothetical protein n=1 Tax=Campylobacter lari TaxID=201 RepID=UPI0012BE099D|nr:hypothetical protein [Campylobacter lari]EAK0799704.1 hypothetical protein [Campylobacter lari]EAL0061522.1 hypothetical protein [Campylobacter lari]EIV5071134.1 hypothetical protein [Campylobacter lari]EKL1317308.1 hypothetical protein [Campylobacter lari]MCR2075865.1 hypothetical protein [Campylobacter lari subsp. concheus]